MPERSRSEIELDEALYRTRINYDTPAVFHSDGSLSLSLNEAISPYYFQDLQPAPPPALDGDSLVGPRLSMWRTLISPFGTPTLRGHLTQDALNAITLTTVFGNQMWMAMMTLRADQVSLALLALRAHRGSEGSWLWVDNGRLIRPGTVGDLYVFQTLEGVEDATLLAPLARRVADVLGSYPSICGTQDPQARYTTRSVATGARPRSTDWTTTRITGNTICPDKWGDGFDPLGPMVENDPDTPFPDGDPLPSE